MSRGIGAHANKVLEDEYVVIYEYGGYNLNEPEYRNTDRIYDGTIRILRICTQNKIGGRYTNRTEKSFRFASFPPMFRLHYALKIIWL